MRQSRVKLHGVIGNKSGLYYGSTMGGEDKVSWKVKTKESAGRWRSEWDFF